MQNDSEIIEHMARGMVNVPGYDDHLNMADTEALAQAALDAQRAMGLVLVSAELVEFLRGAGPLDGYHFGDRPNGHGFWWRRHLPSIAATQGEVE
jgi:hypothetical protein